eukprot:2340611-Rhodomonas_salina.2
MAMAGSEWQAVEEPGRGLYGTWERDNAECVARGLETNDRTKMIQTLFVRVLILPCVRVLIPRSPWLHARPTVAVVLSCVP